MGLIGKNNFLAEKEGGERIQEQDRTPGNTQEEAPEPKKKIFKPSDRKPRSRQGKSSSGGELPDIPNEEEDVQPTTSGYTKEQRNSQQGIKRY